MWVVTQRYKRRFLGLIVLLVQCIFSAPSSYASEEESSSPDAETAEVVSLSKRTWNDISGAYSVVAELVWFDNSKVELRRDNGKTVTVTIEKLSDADVNYLWSVRRANIKPKSEALIGKITSTRKSGGAAFERLWSPLERAEPLPLKEEDRLGVYRPSENHRLVCELEVETVWRTKAAGRTSRHGKPLVGDYVAPLIDRGKLPALPELLVDETESGSRGGDATARRGWIGIEPRDRLVVIPKLSELGENYVGKIIEKDEYEVKFQIQGDVTYGRGGVERIKNARSELRTVAARDITLLMEMPTQAQVNRMVADMCGGQSYLIKKYSAIYRQWFTLCLCKNYVFNSTANRLVSVRDGTELSEGAIAQFIHWPHPRGDYFGEGRALFAIVKGLEATVSGNEEDSADFIGGLANLLHGVAMAEAIGQHDIDLRESRFRTQKTTGLTSKLEKTEVVNRGRFGEFLCVTTTLENERHHPARFKLIVQDPVQWVARTIILGPRETRKVEFVCRKVEPGEINGIMDNMKVWPVTDKELADEMYRLARERAETARDVAKAWAAFRQAIDPD